MTKPKPVEQERRAARQHSTPRTIVGIGASAGGLAALRTFFSNVPEKSGLSFVIVVHLAPEHKSHLADLLQPNVKIPVRQVTETTYLAPDHAYIIPPGCNLNSIDTHLRLSNLEEQRANRAPIDHFFRTLSESHDGHAVGVILTGTGSDGTLGLKEIKGHGGLTIVQDPAEAEYDGMPQSAIATGLVDLVLPVASIPGRILQFANTDPGIEVPTDGEEMGGEDLSLLQKVFVQVRTRTGRDFSKYKRSTILRRIQRRMQLSHIERLADYLALLRENPGESQALSDEFLITVTKFFRDEKIFGQLEKEVVPKLFQNKKPGETVRVWSAGCATGEEAYSLAILLLEAAERQDAPPKVQVFASDLHQPSLKKAREGFYHGDIESDVKPERIKKFFTKENGGYLVRKEVRELVVFAPHDLLGDPPFSRLDFIACRNLLIYLQPEVQRDVIDLFHYALRPGGYLLLGTSETISASGLFKTVDKKHCLHRKRDTPSPETRLPAFPISYSSDPGHQEEHQQAAKQPPSYGALHQQVVERYAPPSLLVGPDYKVVHLSEHVGRYLLHAGGEPTNNIFKLAREEFNMELRAALHNAKNQQQAIKSKPVALEIEGKRRLVTLSVFPADEQQQKGFFVVLFAEQEQPAPPEAREDPGTAEVNDATYRQMEQEMNDAKQKLQVVTEEYETTQEEMQASNEEMQSTNEELRSTMEELETSKEELQSMNEELSTLNQENQHKVDELTQLASDLQNLFKATEIATIFLDRQLRILRFTPRVEALFNVRPADKGRPLSDLTHRLGYEGLLDDARQVLEDLSTVEHEIQDQGEQWYLTRLIPYQSVDGRIDGVVITFVEITGQKKVEAALRDAKEYAEQMISTVPGPLLVLTQDLHVQTASEAFYSTFQVQEQDTIGRKIFELGNGQWNIRALHKLLNKVLPDNNVFESYEITHDFEQIGARTMLLSGRRLEGMQLILVSIQDITARKQMEVELRQSQEQYQTLFDSIDEGFCLIEMIFDADKKPIDYRFLKANPAFEAQTGLHEPVGKRMRELAPGHEEYWFETYGRIALTGHPERFSNEAKELNRWYNVYAFRIGQPEEYKVAILFNDITEPKRTEEALRKSEAHLALILESATDYAIFTMDLDKRVMDWNAGAERMLGYTKEEIIGQKGNVFFPQMDKEGVLDEEIQMVKTENRGEKEGWHIRKDGSRFWGRGILTPLYGTGNKLQGFLKIMTDETERRKMETALQQAKEQAELAAKAKTEFLAHMSHEIRTPLNAIVGLSALLMDQDASPAQMENLNTLKFSAENLQVLINDILDFSKIQAGKATLEEKDFNLAQLLHSLQKAHEPRAKEQGNHLEFLMDEQVPSAVRADQLKLSQVLHNLVGNAVKFTQQGRVDVSVSLKRKKGAQLWLDFSVRDTGMGIPEDKLSLIFDAFAQADNSTMRPYKGTGLGLSITKNLLELMGSKIELESKLGEGSRFYFALPMKKAKDAQKPAGAIAGTQTTLDLQDVKLLLVEDMDINRNIIGQFLKKWWQLIPDEATNGQQAVDMAKKKKYDLILMDVRMPLMDGYQATKAIRGLPGKHYQKAPIIALTADTTDVMDGHPEATLFTDIITKPFEPDDLKGKIIHYVPEAKKRPAVTTPGNPGKPPKKKAKNIQGGKATSGKPAAVPGYALDVHKLEEFLEDDPESIKTYLAQVLEHFAEFQQEFSTAMANRDARALSDLKHKKVMLIDLLGLREWEDLLARCKSLIDEKAGQHLLDEARQKMEGHIGELKIAIGHYADNVG